MKWILILLIFHGNGAPAVVQEEFNSVMDCRAAHETLRVAPQTTVVTGGCFQKS